MCLSGRCSSCRLEVAEARVARQSGGADPKAAAGAAKVPFAAIPWAVVAESALGMGEGAVKYGAHNWRESGGVEAMTYVAGTLRHLVAFVLGEDTDEASGLPHITKAISSLMVLRDAQINGAAIDNRPPAVPAGFLDGINALWFDTRARAEIAKAGAPDPAPAARPHDALRDRRPPRGGSSSGR